MCSYSFHLCYARISDIHEEAAGPTRLSLHSLSRCPDSTKQMNSSGYHPLEDFPCLMGTLCCHQAVGQSTDLGSVCLFPAGIKLLQQPLGSSRISRSSGLNSGPVHNNCLQNHISLTHPTPRVSARMELGHVTLQRFIHAKRQPQAHGAACLGAWEHLAEQPHPKKSGTGSRSLTAGGPQTATLHPLVPYLHPQLLFQPEPWSINGPSSGSLFIQL